MLGNRPGDGVNTFALLYKHVKGIEFIFSDALQGLEASEPSEKLLQELHVLDVANLVDLDRVHGVEPWKALVAHQHSDHSREITIPYCLQSEYFDVAEIFPEDLNVLSGQFIRILCCFIIVKF